MSKNNDSKFERNFLRYEKNCIYLHSWGLQNKFQMSEKSNPPSPPANIKVSKRKKKKTKTKTLNITKFIMTVLKSKHS